MRRVLLGAVVAVVGLVSVGACSKTNPNYCAEAPLHNCSLLDGSGSSGGCTSSAECAPMVCDTQSRTCVECTTGDSSACSGGKPVCVDDACAPCTTDDECTSGVCRADGTCGDEATTLYAKVTAPAGATCTKADKCTLSAALGKLSATVTVVHLDPGTYSDALALAKDAVLVGRGAIIERASGAVVQVGSSRAVALEGLVLRAGSSSTGVTGVTVGAGALVTIAECEVGPTEGVGVAMTSGGSLVIARSTIHDNLLGGVQVASTTGVLLDLTNSMIYVNGGAASVQNVGGVSISGTLQGGSRIDYVTVVDNGANNSASAHAGGIVCDQSTFAITNSIIAHNAVGGSTTASNANTFGLCATTTGDMIQDTLDGLAMKDPAGHDYHLTTGSTAEGHATATSITIDIDGDSRPQGTGYDSGADELR